MKPKDAEFYVCPITHSPLTLSEPLEVKGEVVAGMLKSRDGHSYHIKQGVPDFTYPAQLAEADAQARSFYDGRAEAYDQFLHLTFFTHNEDERNVRNNFIAALNLQPSARVLEISCGTGRDSELIAQKLGPDGQLYLQDISPAMLARAQERLTGQPVPIAFDLSNACYLPYPDRSFDAVYSFGGIGEFSDIKRSLAEMVRISKVGAKIVIGDESMPPWLRETEFAKILITTNKQFLAPVPLEAMPVEARDVCLKWVIGGGFFLNEIKGGGGEAPRKFYF